MTDKKDIRKKRLKAIALILIVISPFFFFALTVDILLYGNPQWCKIIYMAQKTGIWGLWECPPPKKPNDYTGVWRDWYDDGTKRFEGEYLKGRHIGKHSRWYLGGQLCEEKKYDDEGELHGLQLRHYLNGQLVHKHTCVHGEYVGRSQMWDRKGRVIFSGNGDENGESHGTQIGYHGNGEIAHKSEWVHGKLIGKIKHWDEQGNLTMERWNENGERKVKKYNTKQQK